MSLRYLGSVRSSTSNKPSISSAKGVWTLEAQFQAIAASNWPGSTAAIPAALIAQGTKITPTKGVQYQLTAPGVYYVDLLVLGYSSVVLDIAGGQGGDTASIGGRGGRVQGTIAANPAITYLALVVGGAGSSVNTGVTAPVSGSWYTVGGYNGGGRGVTNNSGNGQVGGGGGASDVRITWGTNYLDYAGSSRILVAAGGGGSTSNGGCDGGGGAYPTGGAGIGYGGADGGTQSAGGALNGVFGLGGENATNTGWNGAGGGGWYGGGAQKTQHGGGAGGSSYTSSTYVSSVTYTNSTRAGDGYIYLTVN